MSLNFSAFSKTKTTEAPLTQLEKIKKAYPGGDFSAKISQGTFETKPITGQDIKQQQLDMEAFQGVNKIRMPFAKEKTFNYTGAEPVQKTVVNLAARAPELLVSLPVAAVNFFRKNIKALVGSAMGQEDVLDKPVMTQQFKSILGFDPARFGISDADLQDTWSAAFQEFKNQESINPSNGNTAKQYQNALTAVSKTVVPDALDVLFGYDITKGIAKTAVGLTKASFRQLPDSILFKIQKQNVSPQAIKDALTGSTMASPAEKKIAEDFIKGLTNKERFELFQVARSYEIKGGVGGIPLTTGVEQTAIGKFAEATLPKLPKLPPQQVALLNAGKLDLQAGFLDVGAISNDINALAQKANSIPELQKLLSPKQLAELTAKGIGIEALYNTLKESPLAQEARKYKSAEEFVNRPNFEYHLSSDPDLVGKTIKGEDVFTTKTPHQWATQLNYERNAKAPQELYLVEVKNPSKIMTEYGHETVSKANEVKVVSKIGNIEKMFGDSPISIGDVEYIKKSQLTDIYNQAVKTAPEAKLGGAVATNANKVVKEATVGRNIPTKQVINQQTGVKQTAPTVELTNKQLLRKEQQVASKAGNSAVSQYKKDKAFLENIDREITRELNKPKGQQRSIIAFVKKLGEFNQTVMSEIKAELGIEKPISKMNLTELKDFITKLKERLKFKFEKGYRPSAETKETLKLKDTPAPELTEQDYIANRNVAKQPLLKRIFGNLEKNVGRGTERILAPISTRLENIDPSLKYAIRKFEYDVATTTQKDKIAVTAFLKKTKKISKPDKADLDLALKNGDTSKINEIIKKYGIEKEYSEVKNTLDDIYKRANAVGFDIGYKKDYFPRMIRDTEGFLEYFGKQEYWSILDEAIKRKEMDLGRYLTQEEKGNLINTMIRGYQGGQVTLSGTGNMKERVIDLVTPELNQFYYDSPTALIKYIETVDDKIAARKFFGKTSNIEGYDNIDESIGTYTADLLAKGKITPRQELELREMLNARFNPRGTHGLLGLYKNLSYIDVMGSFLNAVTQLGDQTWSIYKSGLWRTLKADIKAVLGKSEITKESLGLEASSVAQEFSGSGGLAKTVDKVFMLTGLNKMDRLGKQALVNSVIEKYQKLANKPTVDFLKMLDNIFGKESEQVLADLKSGEITENVKLLAFNELLDFHPVALSEMPEQYLKGGNGRIFYMLKSYTIKQFDIFRREAFREMKNGNFWKGLRNLLYLASLTIITNGVADEIKDLLTNRKTKLSDRVVDQLFKLLGLSRYSTSRIGTDGLGATALDIIMPPTNLVDNVSKDLINLYKDFDESADINKLRTIQDIPLIGKFYYWWFGKGAANTKKYAPKEDNGLPSLPKLPTLPTLPKLPKMLSL